MKSLVVLASLLVIGVANCFPMSNGTDEDNGRSIEILEMDFIGTETGSGRSFFADMSVGKTWEEALAHCSSQGATKKKLASLDQAEFQLLRTKFDPVKFKGGFWTGAKDIQTSRQFSWADTGLAPVGLIWAVPTIKPQTCAYLNVGTFSETNMRMDLCTTKRPVLCVSEP